MSYEYGDDGRVQAAMTDTNLAGGADSLCVATVLVTRYPDEPLTPRPNEVTYDIVFHKTRKRRNHVALMNLKSGTTDGDENVLHPSFMDFALSTSFDLVHGNLDTLQGDRVVVGFRDGNSVQPVILGCLTSKLNTYKGSTAQGERRFMQHKGTTVEIDKGGNVTTVLKDGATLSIKASPVYAQADTVDLTVPIVRTTGDINVEGNVSVGGGASGSFVDAFGKLITVQDGIVIKIT